MSKKGQKIRIEGFLYTDASGEVKEIETKPTKSKTKVIQSEAGNQTATTVATETASQATQGVVQAVVAQAQSMGASGLVAMGSAGAFQANHIFDNSHEVYEIARPMVAEFVDTGTITPPETSKFAGETIPVTTSFVGVKVGEARKQAIAEKAAAKAMSQEVKQAVDEAKEAAKQSEETRKAVVQEQQEKAQAEAREKAVEQLGEEKVQEIEEKLNEKTESLPEPDVPTLPEQNAIREAFRGLFNRDDLEEDATPI
tara:strand:+ start:2455 stop:3219 length:765 start_codon:yes stop_codon:yes gene_type:complete